MAMNRKLGALIVCSLALITFATGCVPVFSLEPQEDENPVGTDHTVTGSVIDLLDYCEVIPELCESLTSTAIGDNVFFEVIAGPNAGKHSDGNCGPSRAADCYVSPSVGGSISWTYRGTGGAGLDTIQFCPLMSDTIEESKALLRESIALYAQELGISQTEVTARIKGEVAEVDPGCAGATKLWFEPKTERPNIGAGLSGLFAGQPTPLPTAAAPAPAAPNPVIRPPSTGEAGLK